MYNQLFGERLQQLRKQKGITQRKLGEDLDLPLNFISQFENGKRRANYKTLILIADYFDVSVDYLVQRTDNPISQKNK
ncbi:MAG: helix-turn-helix domain-containing protein [Oscillospiraceae bacterium]|nr:helix-turn-helix domain-containing protein [Oscillospiraceae bacterium]